MSSGGGRSSCTEYVEVNCWSETIWSQGDEQGSKRANEIGGLGGVEPASF